MSVLKFLRISSFAKICFLVLVLLDPLNGLAQNNSVRDSLRGVWSNPEISVETRISAINEGYESMPFEEQDSIIALSEYHFQLAEFHDLHKEQVAALSREATIYYFTGENMNAMETYNRAKDIAILHADSSLIALVDGNLGNVFLNNLEYQEAIKHYSGALKTFQKIDDLRGQARMYNNLGAVHEAIEYYDQGLEYFEKARVIQAELNNADALYGNIILNIGKMYFFQEKYTEAEIKLKEAIELLTPLNAQYYLANAYFQLAETYSKLDKDQKANIYADKAMAIDRLIGNDYSILASLFLKAELAYKKDPIKSEKMTLELLENPVFPYAEHYFKKRAYFLMYSSLKSNGKTEEALKMYELQIAHRDSAEVLKKDMDLIREAVKNQYEIEIYENDQENIKAQNELKSSQFKKTVAIISVAVVLLILGLYYLNVQTKKFKNKRKELLDEIEKLKSAGGPSIVGGLSSFSLNRVKIETSIGRELNETDWNVLNVLLDDPEIQNKAIAEKVFKSLDGVVSSLRRMYVYFEITNTKYKKIALLMKVVKISNTL